MVSHRLHSWWCPSSQNPGTLISQLDPSWFGLRPIPRARTCDCTSKAKHHPNSERLICTSSLLLLSFWSIPNMMPGMLYHRQSKGKSRGERRRWQIQPCTYRCRRQRAQWCTSLSWELWARPPVLTPVPCRRTHSSQRPQRLQNCLSGPWCLDTQHKVHRHQQIHLRTRHCHWHKPKSTEI